MSDSFPPIFILLAIVLSGVVVVSLVLSKFKQSLLVGYFLCGLIIKNSGILEMLGVQDTSDINALSEIGIVLLLFTIGIEFSVKELKTLKRAVFYGGATQVGLTIICTVGLAMLCGLEWTTALVLGFAFAMSSTAVSLKTFQDLGIPESPQSRVTLGIAIFQDIMTIVFIVLIPAIIGSAGLGGLSIALVKSMAFLAGIGILSKYGLPQMLDAVAKTRSKELFTVTVLGMCAAVALVSGLLGLSAALGAFAAGVVVSESMYSHRVLSDVLPFKDLFLTVFFVSVGLLLDIGMIIENAGYILLMVVLIIVIKGVIAAIAARVSGLKLNTWILPAVALASTGEFSIVLFNKIFEKPVIPALWEQIILAATAITMALLPTMMKWGLAASKKFRKHKSSYVCKYEEEMGMVHQIEELSGHVIICGYGPVGENLHRNLEQADIPVIILETNAETVKTLLSNGTKALFADASDHESLDLANVSTARGLAMTFPHLELVSGVAEYALKKNPEILLYARSKFAANVEALEQAGVHHVMLDEEQSGRAMIRSVMQSYARSIEESWKV